jgi:hypothetical protein
VNVPEEEAMIRLAFRAGDTPAGITILIYRPFKEVCSSTIRSQTVRVIQGAEGSRFETVLVQGAVLFISP